MSVFEDLIDELKNENLLEDTVTGRSRADAAAPVTGTAEPSTVPTPANPAGTFVAAAMNSSSGLAVERSSAPEKAAEDHEFFRKLAMDEVSNLQMVEHVLSGVEREHLKTAPSTYDDLEVKKALHRFLQVSSDPKSTEHIEAEFALRQETEAWNLALYERDQNISVSNLRRYCEDSKPVLSSQALIALARFYRNSSYSEDARGKFDYVMTRLFTRESGEERRQLLFEKSEMIGHINRLYANWSSIALFSGEDDRADVDLTVTRFGEFSKEIGEAESFSELLKSEFFDRVRAYKEERAELFYVPEVAAAAIICNLSIGNQFVGLISSERTKHGADRVGEKYGDEHDDTVSSAAGKTLSLADLLALGPLATEPDEDAVEPASPLTRIVVKDEAAPEEPRFGVNRWLLAVCVVCVLISGGVYIWAEKFAGGNESSALVAAPVAIDDADVKLHIKAGRSTKETFYAVAEPSFNALSEQQKKEYLQKIRTFAEAKSLKMVVLLDGKGKSIAFASAGRLDLVDQ